MRKFNNIKNQFYVVYQGILKIHVILIETKIYLSI
jgi:hypothetical protein